MKVSYNWLAKYVKIDDINPSDLAEKLTRSGVAVDIVEELGKDIKNVVVGYVVEKEKHPDAEKLSLCKVDIGEDEYAQIICGAKNIDKGQKVPVAKVGARLPGGVKIKKAKLRGVESYGMICSADELGINKKLLSKEKSEGILVLKEDAVVGNDVKSLLGLDDFVLELDLTPNRSDCLSMIGVAYEVAATLDREINLPESKLDVEISNGTPIDIDIKAEDACNHYSTRLLTDVKISESPYWLQNCLIASGIRPINNVVDITNFVLLEYGQPLHAFDFKYLDQPKIEVRYANKDEQITSLDDQVRDLDEQMLLITDGIKPVAIAGVMGGANSEVTEETTQVLIESAYFKGSSVRRTSKKLGLRSEASMRFEKGVDPNRIYSALNRAAELMIELTDAKLEGNINEKRINDYQDKKLTIKAENINNKLGTELTSEQIGDIFRKLNFNYQQNDEELEVVIPSRRLDIEIEADLSEEIARLYGYDNIPVTFPINRHTQGGLTEKQKTIRKIRNSLVTSGLQEVVTYSLTNEDKRKAVNVLSEDIQPVSLLTPMSEDRKILRTNLVSHLLEVAQYNINRQNNSVRIYEIGSTFITNEEKITTLPKEKWLISGLITGPLPKHWTPSLEHVDYYYLKGIIEELFSDIGLSKVNYSAVSIEGMHPKRTAEISVDNQQIGFIGQIHPVLQNEYNLFETYVFEIDLENVLEFINKEIDYKPLPKYPSVQRDVAIVMPIDLEVYKIEESISKNGGELLESVKIFDVYTNEILGGNKKSVAFSFTFRSTECTLTDEEVIVVYDKIINALIDEYQVKVRD